MAGPKRPLPQRRESRDSRHVAVRANLAERLRELRKKHELSREALAEESGVSYNQLTKLEDASGGGSIETWIDVADGLGEQLSTLFEPPTGAPATNAAEPAPYVARLKGAERPTPVQIKDLATAAAALDRDAVSALLTLARRLRRSGT